MDILGNKLYGFMEVLQELHCASTLLLIMLDWVVLN